MHNVAQTIIYFKYIEDDLSPPDLSGARHTFFPGLGNDVGSTLAHHLGNIERAVGLAGDGDGSEHRLRLQLQGQDTTLVMSLLVIGTFREGYCKAIAY